MVTWSNGRFIPDFGQTLTLAVDSRDGTLLVDLHREFRAHARIDWPGDDALLSLYLAAAISRIEQHTLIPIMHVAYEWDVMPEYRAGLGTHVILPLQNCTIPGKQFGFELLVAPKQIPTPAVWPLHMEVGYTIGEQVPADFRATIFALALGLYEYRSTPEMQDVHSQTLMAVALSRYWTPRV